MLHKNLFRRKQRQAYAFNTRVDDLLQDMCKGLSQSICATCTSSVVKYLNTEIFKYYLNTLTSI